LLVVAEVPVDVPNTMGAAVGAAVGALNAPEPLTVLEDAAGVARPKFGKDDWGKPPVEGSTEVATGLRADAALDASVADLPKRLGPGLGKYLNVNGLITGLGLPLGVQTDVFFGCPNFADEKGLVAPVSVWVVPAMLRRVLGDRIRANGSCAESARLNSAWNVVPRSTFSYGLLTWPKAASRSWDICRATSQPIFMASTEEIVVLRRASSV
jgi:hypothetical protein